MGFFGKLKQMVGISGIKVNLVLPQNAYKQGETISGVIRITGGPEPKMANRLCVALVEDFPEWTIRKTSAAGSRDSDEDTDDAIEREATETGTSERTEETRQEAATETLTSQRVCRQEITVAEEFGIPAGDTLEYPVSLELPAEAAVTGPNQEWRLKTALDLAGALDTSDTDEITVMPSDDIKEVKDFICKGAGFPAECLLKVEAIDPSGERLGTRVYYM